MLILALDTSVFAWRGVDFSVGGSGGSSLSLPFQAAVWEHWDPPPTFSNLHIGPHVAAVTAWGLRGLQATAGLDSSPAYVYTVEGDVGGDGALQLTLGLSAGLPDYQAGVYFSKPLFGYYGAGARLVARPLRFPDGSRGLVEAKAEYHWRHGVNFVLAIGWHPTWDRAPSPPSDGTAPP